VLEIYGAAEDEVGVNPSRDFAKTKLHNAVFIVL
jgi:hypothetical protein